MKTLNNLVLVATLAGLAMAATADDTADRFLAVCEADVLGHYGEQVTVDLVSKRHYAEGVKMRVAARLDEDNARFASCWVTPGDVVAFELNRREDEALVAAVK